MLLIKFSNFDAFRFSKRYLWSSNRFSVLVGTETIQGNGSIYQVTRIVRYGQTHRSRTESSLALLELNGSLQLNSLVSIAELANAEETLSDGTECVLYFWAFGNLNSVEMTKLNQRFCQRNHHRPRPDRSTICASTIARRWGTRFSNDGAPLICNNKLFGVMSQQNHRPPFFSNLFSYIPAFRDWIQHYTGNQTTSSTTTLTVESTTTTTAETSTVAETTTVSTTTAEPTTTVETTITATEESTTGA